MTEPISIPAKKRSFVVFAKLNISSNLQNFSNGDDTRVARNGDTRITRNGDTRVAHNTVAGRGVVVATRRRSMVVHAEVG